MSECFPAEFPCCDCGKPVVPRRNGALIPDWENGGFVAICDPCHSSDADRKIPRAISDASASERSR